MGIQIKCIKKSNFTHDDQLKLHMKLETVNYKCKVRIVCIYIYIYIYICLKIKPNSVRNRF